MLWTKLNDEAHSQTTAIGMITKAVKREIEVKWSDAKGIDTVKCFNLYTMLWCKQWNIRLSKELPQRHGNRETVIVVYVHFELHFMQMQ